MGVGQEDVRGMSIGFPTICKGQMEWFVVICEFLHYILVVAMECASVGDKLDVIVTDCVQFCVPELIVFSIIVEVEIEGYVIKLTVLQAGHEGMFIELSELGPCYLCKLLLGRWGEDLPVDPSVLRYGDLKSFLGVVYVAILVINLGVESGEVKVFMNVVFNKGG